MIGRPRGSVTECEHTDRPHAARGLCGSCYTSWFNHSTPERNARYKEHKRRNYVNTTSPEKRRAAHLKKMYGLSLDDYEALLLSQNGVCAMCGLSSREPLFVDHDHENGRVRGLLCSSCNILLGWVERAPELVESALAYLQQRLQ